MPLEQKYVGQEKEHTNTGVLGEKKPSVPSRAIPAQMYCRTALHMYRRFQLLVFTGQGSRGVVGVELRFPENKLEMVYTVTEGYSF